MLYWKGDMKTPSRYVEVDAQFHHIPMEVFKKAIASESKECKKLLA